MPKRNKAQKAISDGQICNSRFYANKITVRATKIDLALDFKQIDDIDNNTQLTHTVAIVYLTHKHAEEFLEVLTNFINNQKNSPFW